MRDRLKFILSLLSFFPLSRLLGVSDARGENLERARSLNKEGERLIFEGKYHQAMDVFTQMLKAGVESEYVKGVATFYLGRARMELAEYDEASRLLSQAEQVFGRINKERERAVAQQARARLLGERSQYKESLALFESAASVLSNFQDNMALSEVFSSTAAIHVWTGFPDKALECTETSLRLLPSNPYHRQAAALGNNRGLAHALKQNYDLALRSFEKALNEFRKLGDAKGIAATHTNIGFVHEARSRFSDAAASIEESLRISKQIKDVRAQAVALNHLGTVRTRTGRYKDGANAYEEALRLGSKLGVRQIEADALSNRGLMRLLYGDCAQARVSFEKALDIASEVGSQSTRAHALHNLGYLLKDLGEFNKSLHCSQQASDLALATKNRRLEAGVLLRSGNLYDYLGLFDAALKNYEIALSIALEIEDAYAASTIRLDLGNSYARRGDPVRAAKHYEDAVKTRRGIGSPVRELLCKVALFFVERSGYAKDSGAGDRKKDQAGAEKLLAEAARAGDASVIDETMLLTYVQGKLLLETDPKQATSRFEKLSAQAKSAGHRKYSFLASTCLGLAHEKQGNRPAAEAAFKEAAAYAESIRKALAADQRASFLEGEEILGLKHKVPYEGIERVGSG